MIFGRLQKLGNSYAVIVPATLRRELKWWPSDNILLEIQDGALILSNTTQHDVRPITITRENGDKRYSRS